MVWSDGQFLAYSAGVFRPVTSTALRTRLSALHGRPLSGSVKDKRRITITQRVIGDTLGCLRDLLAEPTQQVFTGQPSGVAFRDVFVKIDGGQVVVVPHSPLNGARMWVDALYDPQARCPKFERFLDGVLRPSDHEDGVVNPVAETQAKKTLLWEWLGVALAGRACDLGKALLLSGFGGTGKSTLLQIMRAFWPPDLVSAVPLHALEHAYDRAVLAGKMLNVCGELPSADADAVETAKAMITGKDLVEARHPYERPFSFLPRAAHLMAANRLPFIGDYSGAFFERFVILNMTQKFRGAIHEDLEIADRIVEDELGAIASRALQAAVKPITARRYTTPPSSRTAVSAWQNTSDSTRAWAELNLRQAAGPHEGTYASELYGAYATWATFGGYRPMAANKFSAHLRAAGHTSQRTQNGNRFNVVILDKGTKF